MSNYYESLKSYQYNDYLTTQPTKRAALENAALNGKISILNNSNNRAITIITDDAIYLQSYDTLILKYHPETSELEKLWDGYSVTTLKHINEFISIYIDSYKSFNKKEWLAFQGGVFYNDSI